MSRKGPSDHAADYDEGHIKKGNDNNIWMIISSLAQNSNKKIKRWVKIADIFPLITSGKRSFASTSGNGVMIKCSTLLTLSSVAKPKLIYLGYMNIYDTLTMGDTIIYQLKDFEAGKYQLYKLNNSLIISRRAITLESLLKKTLIQNNQGVTVDSGCFTFRDAQTLRKYADLVLYICNDLLSLLSLEKKKKNEKDKIMNHMNYITKSSKDDLLYGMILNSKSLILKRKDITIDKILIDNFPKNIIKLLSDDHIKKYNKMLNDICKDPEAIIDLYISNGHGDGLFNCMKNDSNTIFIQLDRKLSNIIEQLRNL